MRHNYLSPQNANETASIKSKIIEDQTDSIKKLRQVSIRGFHYGVADMLVNETSCCSVIRSFCLFTIICAVICFCASMCFDHTSFTPLGVNDVQLLRDSEPIRLLETPKTLRGYIFNRAYLPILLLSHLSSSWERGQIGKSRFLLVVKYVAGRIGN